MLPRDALGVHLQGSGDPLLDLVHRERLDDFVRGRVVGTLGHGPSLFLNTALLVHITDLRCRKGLWCKAPDATRCEAVANRCLP